MSIRPPDGFESPRQTPLRTRRFASVRNTVAALLLLVTFGSGVAVDRLAWDGGEGAGASSSLSDSPEFATLQQTWDLIHSDYVDSKAVDDQDLLYGASRGMIDALGDTGHSRFLDPEQAKEFDESLQGELVGIGIYVDFRTGLPVVVVPIEGSPAEKAGIKPGDVITDIDGTSTEGMTADAVSDALRGDEGSEVTVTLERAKATEPVTVKLTRARIKVVPVSWAMLPDGVAVIKLSDFSSGATDGIQAAVKEIKAQGATSVVLDLRDNPGGLVTEAIGVGSEFLKEGSVLYQEEDRDGAVRQVKTVGGQSELDLPMVVLINGNSASAAEIVAAGLRDNGRAKLLGETTFGTGTVLSPFGLNDGSVALLGTELWLTPKGDQIWKVGVAPDIEIALPADVYPSRQPSGKRLSAEDLQATEDVQLQSAYDLLTGKAVPATPVASPAA